MTEIVKIHDPEVDHTSWELERADGSRLTDLELGWPQSIGVTASFLDHGSAVMAVEQLGCYDCGEQDCTYVTWANLALCSRCINQRGDDMEGDSAYDARVEDGC